MNVKIGNQNLRFKISGDELVVLLGGCSVHTNVGLLDKSFVVSINPAGRGAFMEAKLVLDGCEAYLSLLVSAALVQGLSDMEPSREGVSQEVGGVCVTLQVDMADACKT